MLDLQSFSGLRGITLKREAEKAGTRYVLAQILGTSDLELNYTHAGKPYLIGRSEYISISHSHNRLVVIVNKSQNTGIDIELIRDKVQQVQHKFLNETEKQMAAGETDKLISFWAAKETLYKVYGLKQISFRQNLFIEQINNNEIIGRIEITDFKKRYRLACEKQDMYRMVYVIDEI